MAAKANQRTLFILTGYLVYSVCRSETRLDRSAILPRGALNVKRRTILLATLLATLTPAAPYDAKLFAEMRWRMVGPLRGGRTRACAGVARPPNIFYIGAGKGRGWETHDQRRPLKPHLAHSPTRSISATA